MNKKIRRRGSRFAGLAFVLLLSNLSAQTFVEETYEEFADGKLDAAGQNLYVSRDGSVRTIHRFDLNQDGFIDLVFNNTHDRRAFIPATSATVSSGGKILETTVAVEGSRQTVIADLNRDGHLDLIFCPNASGVQTRRRFLTLAYGGPDGWPQQRTTGLLPVHDARKVAVTDLNADEWPDIVTLNSEAWLPGQPSGGAILRMYWGSKDGFLLTRRLDMQVEGALDIAAGDIDQDGVGDLAVLTGQEQIVILWGGELQGVEGRFEREVLNLPGSGAATLAAADASGDGRPDLVVGSSEGQVYLFRRGGGRGSSTAQVVPGFPASHVSVGEVDGDDLPEIVLTHFEQNRAGGGEASGAAAQSGASVRILWGADGWDRTRATALDMPYATAAAIGDLDYDGQADLAIAVHQNDETYRAMSSVLLGQGGREFRRLSGPSTEGAMHVAIAPKTRRHPARAVFANSLGGTVGERIKSQVFWGSAADFDKDGALDIAVACHTSDGDHTTHSKVFYNDGRRFENPRVEKLLTYGPHWMGSQDMGHIAHRRWEQTYESSVFEWDGGATRGRLTSDEDTPAGAGLSFEVRSAGDEKELADRPWHRLAGESFQLESADRVLQYRAAFHSPNGDSFATLRRVEIRLAP